MKTPLSTVCALLIATFATAKDSAESKLPHSDTSPASAKINSVLITPSTIGVTPAVTKAVSITRSISFEALADVFDQPIKLELSIMLPTLSARSAEAFIRYGR